MMIVSKTRGSRSFERVEGILHRSLTDRIKATFGNEAPFFDVSLRFYVGTELRDGRCLRTHFHHVMSACVRGHSAYARSANRMAKACNPYFSIPVTACIELPTMRFVFSG